MFPGWLLTVLGLGYVIVLFALAWLGDKHAEDPRRTIVHSCVYGLSLGVYCTSWTFYGAVGTAVTSGWGYLPIYLGPILVILFGWNLVQRMVHIGRRQNITSIADLLSLRYGRSRAIAAVVTLMAVIGGVPYIALQLKAINQGTALVNQSQTSGSVGTLYLALGLGFFAALFGTREASATEHHRGMMWALALESVVKIIAFVAVGLFSLYGVLGGFDGMSSKVLESEDLSRMFALFPFPASFATATLLSMAAIVCLPRQFHVMVVEYERPRDLRFGRWIFPAYLLLFSFFVVPIAVAGFTVLGANTPGDNYVVALPAALDQSLLSLLSVLGGFSAATGMVIVACVALATMVSNDLITPLFLRLRQDRGDLSRVILMARRAVIFGLVTAAWLFAETTKTESLAGIGLLAFAAVAQFAPALVLGFYWKRSSREGALAGLIVGFVFWVYTLLLPAALGGDHSLILHGLFEKSWLRPEHLFGLQGMHPLNHGVMWSLGLNILTLVLVSIAHQPRLTESMDVAQFAEQARPPDAAHHAARVTAGELRDLAARFMGIEAAYRSFASFLAEHQIHAADTAPLALIRYTENVLAGIIGSGTARRVLTDVLRQRGVAPREAIEMLATTSRAVRFNRQLLDATLNSLTQGVSVVDEELRLIGWNESYLRIFSYPEGMVYAGRPVEDLIRYNRARFLDTEDDEEIEKRLAYMREGHSYKVQREWLDGRSLEIQGNPMPNGGYVSTFTDITAYKQAEQSIKEINETLELRVEQRTRELVDTNDALIVAREAAEQANQAKTRFLAAASHDLLQPLNAARLFASVLQEKENDMLSEHAHLVDRLNASLGSAEDLLGALLDIARLERGSMVPKLENVAVRDVIARLNTAFVALFEQAELDFRVHGCDGAIRSDIQMLTRILQNFLANALRYTPKGGVLLAARRRGEVVRFSVYDTGPGIDMEQRDLIFEEFRRLDTDQARGPRGLGLGLSISTRMATMLGHRLHFRSRQNRGSAFHIDVPLAEYLPATPTAAVSVAPTQHLRGAVVLCVDNEPSILEGMRELLTQWQCEVICALGLADLESAMGDQMPDIILMDYHLDGGTSGLDAVDRCRSLLGQLPPVIFVSANRSDALTNTLAHQGFRLIKKPVRPAKLRAVMTNVLRDASGQEEFTP